jgi:hypothetical protein
VFEARTTLKMDNGANKPDQGSRPSRPDGFRAHWRQVVVVCLGLVVLLMMSPEFRDSLGRFFRVVTPAPSHGEEGENDKATAAPDGSYKSLYEVELERRKELHRILYSRAFDEGTVIDAMVIKRDPHEGYYTGDLMLNQGSRSNVRVGMAVMNRDRMVVGRIAAVDKSTSTLRLITHPSVSLAVRVQGRAISGMTQAETDPASKGGIALLLPPPALSLTALQTDERVATKRDTAQDEPKFLSPGDLVVTDGSADPDNLADGLPVGQISHADGVGRSTSEYPLRARLVPGRLDSLRNVKIVVPSPLPSASHAK